MTTNRWALLSVKRRDLCFHLRQCCLESSPAVRVCRARGQDLLTLQLKRLPRTRFRAIDDATLGLGLDHRGALRLLLLD